MRYNTFPVQERWFSTLQQNQKIIGSFFNLLESKESVELQEDKKIPKIPEEVLTSIKETRQILIEIASRSFFLEEELSQPAFTLVIETNNLIVKALTRIEDFLYREGEKKEKIRILMFILTFKAGEALVPGADKNNEKLKYLDYRKKGAKKEKQYGELMEAHVMYSQYKKDDVPTTHIYGLNENAFNLLIEMADVVYNTTQAITFTGLLEVIEQDEKFDDIAKQKMKKLAFFLMQLGMLKFLHRYIFADEKNEEEEKKEIKSNFLKGILPLVTLNRFEDVLEDFFSFFHRYNHKSLGKEVKGYFADDKEYNDFMQTMSYSLLATG